MHCCIIIFQDSATIAETKTCRLGPRLVFIDQPLVINASSVAPPFSPSLAPLCRVHPHRLMRSLRLALNSSPLLRRRCISSTTSPAMPLSAINVTAQTPKWADWRLEPATATPTTSTMFKNQGALPHLPVPVLATTLARVLESCRPLAKDDAELAALEAKVAEFGRPGGMGPVLQSRLEHKAAETTSWLAEDWDSQAYMLYRDSVVVNVSYYYGFSRLPQSPPTAPRAAGAKAVDSDPAYVAASIISTALEFRRLVAQGLLEPEQVGKPGEGELCMESFKWAFNACRVPASPADYAVKVAEDEPELAQHMVVIRKNQFWKVSLRDASGREYSVAEFKQ